MHRQVLGWSADSGSGRPQPAVTEPGRIVGYTEIILQRVREVIEANRRGTWTINAETVVRRETALILSGREIPPGNWFAPPGSNRSSGGGNEAAEAFGVEGRIGDSVSMQAVT